MFDITIDVIVKLLIVRGARLLKIVTL